MALVKCTECQREISSDAKACPGCGKKPKKSVGVGGLIIAVLFGILVFNLAGKGDSATPTVSTLTPEQQAVHDKAAKNSNARITNTIRTKRSIKDNLRDPNSLEWVSSAANEDGSVVCVVYRARNGFGGMNVERAVMVDQTIRTDSTMWQQNCVGKKLIEI